MTQLEEARKYLEDIQREFANDPELLAIYEPTAVFLVWVLQDD
jgi:hypothetical protein